MNDLKIKELEIKAFRGIKHEDLELDSKSLVLLGENGTGKSSIVQAIEYLLTSELSAFTGEGTGDLNANDVMPFFGTDKSELSVKTTFNNDLAIERNMKGFYASDEIKSQIKPLSNGANILNRKKLLNYVDSIPSTRYNKIGKMFGFNYIDQIGQIFNKECNSLENTLTGKKYDYTNSLKTLSKRLDLDFNLRYKKNTKKNKVLNYESSKGQYEKCIEELNKRIDGKFPLLESDTNVEEYLKDLQETLNSNNKRHVKTILDTIKNMGNLDSKEEELDQIIKKYELFYLDSAKNASLLLNLLDESREYIQANNSSICPVCKSDIDAKKVCEDIDSEINELKKNLGSIEALKEETYEFIYYLDNIIDNLSFIERQIDLIDDEDNEKILNSHRENIESLEKLESDLKSLINFEISANDVENSLSMSHSKLIDLSKHLESNYLKEDDEYQETLDLLNQCLVTLISLNKTQKDIDSLEKELEVAKIVDKIYQKEKIKYISNTLEKLTDRINEYYAFIHKDDGIKNPRFEVSGATGLKLRMDSFNKESDPREYSSEGHLDTLGLCITLAFIKENSSVPIIVLDDIIATVDSSHKERIARLLLDEFKDYQLIITTHNKMWFNQIRHLVKARQKHSKQEGEYKDYQFVEIKSWNIDEGPYLSNHKTDVQTIQKHLINKELVAAVHASRRYLENILRNICITNKARILYKETPYFLMEYLNAAKKEVEFHTKGTELEYYYDDVFFEIEQTRFLGNSFVHGDEDDDLTFFEASTFCDAVYDLHEAVTCEECGSYIEFNRKSGKGRCTNRNCSETFEL